MSHCKSFRRSSWQLAIVLVLWQLITCAVLQAQSKPAGTGKSFPEIQIPFFGEGNPFERLFRGGDPADIDKARKVSIPEKDEREYGERILEAARQNWKDRGIQVVSRGADVDYVQKLVDVLKKTMHHRDRYRSIRVMVAQSDDTDAFSIPGGTIIVFRGMIEYAESEAALVGVIGHELSHLDRGHQLLPLQHSKLFQTASRERGPASFDQFMKQASQFMSMFMRPFRPEDELEADRDGATWAYQANYDPREMAKMFDRMNQRNQIGQFVPSFLRTHPYHGDRRNAIEALFDELQRTDPHPKLYIGRENLQRRIPMSIRQFPE